MVNLYRSLSPSAIVKAEPFIVFNVTTNRAVESAGSESRAEWAINVLSTHDRANGHPGNYDYCHASDVVWVEGGNHG